MTQNRPDRVETQEVIGQRYLILHQLREEPWGDVWLAQDNLLRTEVGLKLLPRDDPEWARTRDMFEHEAILGLKLRHPQILGVFHVDKAERFLYLVQEPFPGVNLLNYLSRQKRYNLSQALDLMERLGQALVYAHQNGEVHQALNPFNILLQEEDLRLANFAFAPAYDNQPVHLELKAYAPPEVIHGERLTPGGNVFSLGVLGFRLVAGSLPYPLTFDEPFPYRLEYPPADLEEIPVPLQNVLLRCLAEDPEERLPHAGAFLSHLRQAKELILGVSKEPYASSQPERSRIGIGWAPLAQAGPLLKKVWEEQKPRAQKVKETALTHWYTLKQAPRRLWWGVGLTVLIVALIVGGVKLGSRPASRPYPAKVAAPVSLPLVGGGPPLMETGEAESPREPVPPAKPATSQPPGQVQATPAGESARGSKEDRYLLAVATFGTMKQAEALQQRLRAKKIQAIIIKRKTGDKTLYQVQVGPLTGAKAANDLSARIKNQEKIAPKVVKLSPPASGANNVRRPSR
ncbi:MAG: protein kinase domain-containing protein [Thermodesulfobacteriota bacterium]